MTPDRWPAIRALFEAALALESNQRGAFLDLQCNADVQLRDDVQALLDADDLAAGFTLDMQAPELMQALGDTAQRDSNQALIGARLGVWKLQRELGRGGMGAVYLAERDDGEYRQLAAVKLMLPGWNALELIERFRVERQILANLNHPNIARLLDGGVSAQGNPYLVLEYVPGQPIDRYCDAHSMSIRARLALFGRVCDAVAHAHRALIVHRDLKPSNIFVSDDGVVKLLDFGIAKLLTSAGPNGAASIAQSQTRVFTPEFAAPEQVRGEPATTGVDVYALGMLLFALLTGKRPYGQTAKTPAAYEQAILTEESDRPSRAADAMEPIRALQRGLPPRALSKALRGDLDAIVLKALRKETVHRYASVDALAEDVGRYLANQPVAARRGNWRYSAARFIQRNAWASALGTIAVLALITGFGLAVWQTQQAQIARARAEVQAQQKGAVAQFMTRVFSQADPMKADQGQLSARALLDQGMRDISDQPNMDPHTRTALLLAIGQAYGGLSELALAEKTLRTALDSAKTQNDPSAQVEIMLALGSVVGQNTRDDEALALLQQAAQTLAGAGASTERARQQHISHLLDLHLARQLNNMRREPEALPYLERALATIKSEFGETSAELSDLLPLYAIILSSLGRSKDALNVVEQSYAAAQAEPGLPATRRMGFAEALAFTSLNQGRYPQAERAFREVLAIEEQIYDVGQLQTTSTLSNVAVALLRQERFAQASALFEQVVAIRKRFLEPNDVRIARALFNVATAQRSAGAMIRAQELLNQGLELWDRSGATREDLYVSALLELALINEDSGQIALAAATANRLQVYTNGALQSYAGKRMDRILVLLARLEDRQKSTTSACTAANVVFGAAKIRDSVRVEALVLKAHCERRHDQQTQAQQTLAQLDQYSSLLGELSPYSRALYEGMLVKR